jgi:hypothetical protein
MFWLFWQLVGVFLGLVAIGFIISLFDVIGSYSLPQPLYRRPELTVSEPSEYRKQVERRQLAIKQIAAKAAKAKQIAEHNARIMADWRAGKGSYSYHGGDGSQG